MVFRDAIGQTIEEGDIIAFGTEVGKSVPGRVEKLDPGLGLQGPVGPNGVPQSVPLMVTRVTFVVQCMPDGLIPGIFKIVSNPDKKSTIGG